MAEWIPTANLRFETRPYQEATEFYGGGTVTRYRNVLQQEFQHGETGRMQWRDVPAVTAQERSMTDVALAKRRLKFGEKHPYHGRAPTDDAERAALGVLADLCDRSGVGNALEEPDDEIKAEIVTSLAAIIRLAFSE